MSRCRRLRAVMAGAVLLAAGVAAPAAAWNDTGHMIAALIAYDELSALARDDLARTLRAHPRFEADFERRMPRALRGADADEQQRWLFAFAATWPDLARHFGHVSPASAREALVDAHHRGRWHYINLPTYLEREDQRALGIPAVNDGFEWSAADDTRQFNIVQALAMLASEYDVPTSDAAERAEALCWLLHLLADLHQPLHTTALFTSNLFPDGDRGGNELRIDADRNLHSLWDGALGRDRRWQPVLDRVAAFTATVEPDWPPGELTETWSRQFGHWARAGRELAEQRAYVPEILAQVAAANRAAGAAGAVPPAERRPLTITLPDGYEEAMQAAAEVQILLAGWRTAWVLEQLSTPRHEAGLGRSDRLGLASVRVEAGAGFR